MLYRSAADIDFRVGDLPAMPQPGRVLLATPEHFDVLYVINPHMEDQVGQVDRAAAQQQWHALRSAYESLGLVPQIVQGVEGLPDMVFCANQSLPFYRMDGTRGLVMSRMYADERKGEVPHIARFFQQRGYEVLHLPPETSGYFEGMGDALWHPRRALLWGGHGIRTDASAYDGLLDILDVPVLLLHLVDPAFYHLDTCLCLLDEETALYFPGAFDERGLEFLRHFFPRLLEAPEDEARNRFACNAHCPDGQNVLIQEGCEATNHLLREAGFTPVPCDTSEFIKAGGSVFCMKLAYW